MEPAWGNVPMLRERKEIGGKEQEGGREGRRKTGMEEKRGGKNRNSFR